MIEIILNYEGKAWLKPDVRITPYKHSFSCLDIMHTKREVFWYEGYWKRTSKMKSFKIMKTLFFLCLYIQRQIWGVGVVKINAKDWKKYSYIRIHKYMVAVYSRKILWRSSLDHCDLSEEQNSLFHFLVSSTKMRYQPLEDKEIHLSTTADLRPMWKKWRKYIYFYITLTNYWSFSHCKGIS